MPQVLPRTQGEPLIWRTSWTSRLLPIAHQFLLPLLEEQLMTWLGGGPGGLPPPPPPPTTKSARQPLSTQRPPRSTPQVLPSTQGEPLIWRTRRMSRLP